MKELTLKYNQLITFQPIVGEVLKVAVTQILCKVGGKKDTTCDSKKMNLSQKNVKKTYCKSMLYNMILK